MDEKKAIFKIIENAVALAGYKILDGDADTVIIKSRETEDHFSIKVQEEAD